MKKFTRKLLLFVLFFALFFVLINFFYLAIISLTDWDFKKRLESINFDNPDFELLVIGNSFPEYGVDTELLTAQGIKSYNMALVGSSKKTNYIQLKEYLTKYPNKPKYVLLCLNATSEAIDKEGIQPIVEFTMKNHRYSVKDIPISKFRWLGVEIFKKLISSKHRKARISYGQIKWEKNSPDETDFSEIYLNLQMYESSKWVGEIVKLCNQSGIEILLVEIPGLRETQNLSEIGPYFLSFSNGYSAVLYNYNSRDFCTIFDPEKHWIGQSHLNEFGACKFTEQLISIIKKRGTNAQ